jgi:hypothetical protein
MKNTQAVNIESGREIFELFFLNLNRYMLDISNDTLEITQLSNSEYEPMDNDQAKFDLVVEMASDYCKLLSDMTATVSKLSDLYQRKFNKL